MCWNDSLLTSLNYSLKSIAGCSPCTMHNGTPGDAMMGVRNYFGEGDVDDCDVLAYEIQRPSPRLCHSYI